MINIKNKSIKSFLNIFSDHPAKNITLLYMNYKVIKEFKKLEVDWENIFYKINPRVCYISWRAVTVVFTVFYKKNSI